MRSISSDGSLPGEDEAEIGTGRGTGPRSKCGALRTGSRRGGCGSGSLRGLGPGCCIFGLGLCPGIA